VTGTVGVMELRLFDLSQLRLTRRGGAVVLYAPSGAGLANLAVDDAVSDREAAFLVFDHALDDSRIDGAPIAFYNPVSHQVSFGPVERNLVFDLPGVLRCPPDGLVARIDGAELVIGSRRFAATQPSWTAVLTVVAAH
jgi:hypothetical protein